MIEKFGRQLAETNLHGHDDDSCLTRGFLWTGYSDKYPTREAAMALVTRLLADPSQLNISLQEISVEVRNTRGRVTGSAPRWWVKSEVLVGGRQPANPCFCGSDASVVLARAAAEEWRRDGRDEDEARGAYSQVMDVLK